MEKFSAFRDPGTGIQPFLTPLPPVGSEVLKNVLLPFGFLVGAIRTTLVVILAALYVLLVESFCRILAPVPPLYRLVSYLFTAIISRLVLLIVGLWWIPVEKVTRKRGRGAKAPDSWKPKVGDVIVSNWASWIELLWLAFRFNPIFVLPVSSPVDLSTKSSTSDPITSTPGRRTGTGSAAISSPKTRKPTPCATIVGFRQVSLLSMIRATGNIPLDSTSCNDYVSLEEIRTKADRPIVVFPECTTSNGRGLLRFADVFKGVDVPVTGFSVFVMCVRYDPPTNLTSSLSHSIPSSLNPLTHIFKLSTSFVPLTLSIRLLAPAESPSSRSFLLSDFLLGGYYDDQLSECCAALIAQIGKFKRTGMGWEDKAAFLEFYQGKKRS
ncbi:hypothetical protein QCA50_000109 [Cerrena zonata]|uniref:Phospholipid/glycerol acyltransferase domain-containing protein n=1 Tax=Cerrena zonata TaxID=2478898 RepID=A0AAW0GPE5_9APHY